MKKITGLFLLMLLAAPCILAADAYKEGLRQSLYGDYDTDPVRNAILVSDYDAFKANLGKPNQETLDSLLGYAEDICDKYRTRGTNEKQAAVCDKTNNAKIIKTLIDAGANPNRLYYAKEDVDTIYIIQTTADFLKTNNPSALGFVVPKMDKCLTVLTQMQGADPTKKNYEVYADYWKNNNCSLKNYHIYRSGFYNDKDKARFMLIGQDIAAVKALYGEKPTVYERPSENREVLTYKTMEENDFAYRVEGQKGVGHDYYADQYDHIITLDRGVVTRVVVKKITSTNAKTGEVNEIDHEALKAHEQQIKEKQAGHIPGKRGAVLM